MPIIIIYNIIILIQDVSLKFASPYCPNFFFFLKEPILRQCTIIITIGDSKYLLRKTSNIFKARHVTAEQEVAGKKYQHTSMYIIYNNI